MGEADRAIPAGMLRERKEEPERTPQGEYCRGTTRDGRPCPAHSAIVRPSGYCHRHDPDLASERRAWCDARRGPRWIRWGISLARFTGDLAPAQLGERLLIAHAEGSALSGRDDSHPSSLIPAPRIDALPMGQRRVVEALLAGETGRTYAEAAGVLGIQVSALHAHLARIRRRHPATYDAIMAKRAQQLGTRHEAAAEREDQRTATRRAAFVAEHGREPWAS